MKEKILKGFIVCLLGGVFLSPLEATYVFKNGTLIEASEVATMSVQEHYSAAIEAFQNEKWEELVRQATIVIKNFPASPFAHESVFFLGAGYFHTGELERADASLSRYLKKQAVCQHFEEAVDLRQSIAEGFRQGAKKHLFGVQSLPKWIPAGEDALGIYDEIIAALPHHDIAARALFGKGMVLRERDEYRLAIEIFQNLIRRFPKHPLATSSYVEICRCYFSQAKIEFPNPDFLSLAEINLLKFQDNFPGDVKVEQAKEIYHEMEEFYAGHLYDTARFFERTKKPQAAKLYYTKLSNRYPSTKAAGRSLHRLEKLKKSEKVEEPVTEKGPQAEPVADAPHESS